jgi:hypothetical protein
MTDLPNRSRFSVVFLGPRANAELVPKFHVALRASYTALPMVTSKFYYTAAFPTCQKLYLLLNIPLPEGRAGNAWEPSKPKDNKKF